MSTGRPNVYWKATGGDDITWTWDKINQTRRRSSNVMLARDPITRIRRRRQNSSVVATT
ncbi:hypothetical protein RHGRI_015591 [Rhododendron griersonianum]|uniref:Uncharacterized protein n=1 Tax=Rhododendron griersonianum TaxID=479676 RepID=A0AAV6KEC4_9ERIC|nr:hypothetical protein RHGRI_015591 [Rhododendron griersonianum]